jgi:hypothetical protein
MNFWNNIIRYPRFFISSMIGLFLVIITSLLKIFKDIPDKKVLFILFLLVFAIIILILSLMLNLNYY